MVVLYSDAVFYARGVSTKYENSRDYILLLSVLASLHIDDWVLSPARFRLPHIFPGSPTGPSNFKNHIPVAMRICGTL